MSLIRIGTEDEFEPPGAGAERELRADQYHLGSSRADACLASSQTGRQRGSIERVSHVMAVGWNRSEICRAGRRSDALDDGLDRRAILQGLRFEPDRAALLGKAV